MAYGCMSSLTNIPFKCLGCLEKGDMSHLVDGLARQISLDDLTLEVFV